MGISSKTVLCILIVTWAGCASRPDVKVMKGRFVSGSLEVRVTSPIPQVGTVAVSKPLDFAQIAVFRELLARQAWQRDYSDDLFFPFAHFSLETGERLSVDVVTTAQIPRLCVRINDSYFRADLSEPDARLVEDLRQEAGETVPEFDVTKNGGSWLGDGVPWNTANETSDERK